MLRTAVQTLCTNALNDESAPSRRHLRCAVNACPSASITSSNHLCHLKFRNGISSKLSAKIPLPLSNISILPHPLCCPHRTHLHLVAHVHSCGRNSNDIGDGDPGSSRSPAEELVALHVHVCPTSALLDISPIRHCSARLLLRFHRPPFLIQGTSRRNVLAYLTKAGSMWTPGMSLSVKLPARVSLQKKHTVGVPRHALD